MFMITLTHAHTSNHVHLFIFTACLCKFIVIFRYSTFNGLKVSTNWLQRTTCQHQGIEGKNDRWSLPVLDLIVGEWKFSRFKTLNWRLLIKRLCLNRFTNYMYATSACTSKSVVRKISTEFLCRSALRFKLFSWLTDRQDKMIK